MKTQSKETIEFASIILYAGLLFIAVLLIAKVGIGMWEQVGDAYIREISTISGL